MEREPLSFEEKRQEIVDFFASTESAIMALATSADGRVLARMVLITCEGLGVCLFAWGGPRKCEQIRANPRVALCKDRVQIEGTAEILGSLFDPENASI